MDFETRAIHEGQEPDPTTGALTTPIYLTSTYVQDAVGEHKRYDYSRVANPTRTALQQCLASLESAEHGIAFSSGLGAVTTVLHFFFQAEDGIRDLTVTGVQTCALPILNGFALGGGCELALACDIVVAAQHARFGLPEPRVGFTASDGGIHRIVRQLPLKIDRKSVV